MTASLDLFLCGPAAQPQSERSPSAAINVIAAQAIELSRAAGASLSALMDRSTADCVAIVDADRCTSPQILAEAAARWTASSQASAAVACFDREDPFSRAWRQLPSWLACFLCTPDELGAVVFRKSLLSNIGDWSNHPAPLWNAMIRFAMRENGVECVETDTINPQSALSHAARPALVPGRPSRDRDWLLRELRAFEPAQRMQRVVSRSDAVAVKAGLLLLHDDLDESHRYSQSVQGEGRHRAGDYWHAVMHRREPDYSNSKYWFRRVGSHPVFSPLAARAHAILDECDSSAATDWRSRLKTPGDWDPSAFVDLCAACENGTDRDLRAAAEAIQLEEMLLLLTQTYADATE